jgi:hypothetical protein
MIKSDKAFVQGVGSVIFQTASNPWLPQARNGLQTSCSEIAPETGQ